MGYVAVPSWLQVVGPRWLEPRWLAVQVLLAGTVAWVLDGLVCYLSQPLKATLRGTMVGQRRSGRWPSPSPPKRSSQTGARRQVEWGPGKSDGGVGTPAAFRAGAPRARQRGGKGRKPGAARSDGEDIILIELD